MESEYDVIIIGSGPGGLTAAVYTGRYARKTLIVEGQAGGTAAKSGDIENWPGTKKIPGMELMNKFREHAEEYGTDFVQKLAKSVKKEGDFFVVDLGDETVKGKTIIFSIGMKTRKLGVSGEEELVGKGVSYCATCDGMFFRGKDVVVVGGADSACKATVYLGDICNKVTIIYRKDKLRGEPVYVKKIEEKDNIETVFNSSPVEIFGKEKVEGIKIKDNEGNESEIKADGVFVEIGALPITELLSDLGIELDEVGFTKVGRDMKTNVDGVFAIGDMTNSPLRQIVTAAGEGAVAANGAHEYLNKLGA